MTENERGPRVAIFWGRSNQQAKAHADRLGAELFCVYSLGNRKGPLFAALKYVPQCLKTWRVLARERPSAAYVVISPVFAALSVYLYCMVSRCRLIIDIHNHALYGEKWRWSLPLVRFLVRRSFAVIIDQERNKSLLGEHDTPVFLLERSPLPVAVDDLRLLAQPDEWAVTVINTFADDEPVAPILDAARQTPDVTYYITGDPSRGDAEMLAGAPDNVVFTGFLNGDDYWSRLYSSRAIMALTTADFSLLAAAIEAMAIKRPAILSRVSALTGYFSKGAAFVDHTGPSIAAAVEEIKADEKRFVREIEELATEKEGRWCSVSDRLVAMVSA